MAVQLTAWTATTSMDAEQQQHRDGDPSTSEIMSISVFFAIGILLLVAVCIICSKHHPSIAIPPVIPRRDHQHRHNAPLPSHAGLNKVEIALIPTFAYKSPTAATNSLGSPAAVQNCAVCLSPVAEGEMVRQLPACNHLFHVECVDMWLFSNPTCPLCRTNAKALAAGLPEKAEDPSPSPVLIQNSPSLAV